MESQQPYTVKFHKPFIFMLTIPTQKLWVHYQISLANLYKPYPNYWAQFSQMLKSCKDWNKTPTKATIPPLYLYCVGIADNSYKILTNHNN